MWIFLYPWVSAITDFTRFGHRYFLPPAHSDPTNPLPFKVTSTGRFYEVHFVEFQCPSCIGFSEDEYNRDFDF